MLSCKEVSERSGAFIDGEMGLWEQLPVRLHLAMCKGCTAFMCQMRASRDLAREVATAEGMTLAEGDAEAINAILLSVHDRKHQGAVRP